MRILKAYLYSLGLIMLLGCQPEPKPIAYGQANCTHCNMTVSDNRYGAELVNEKGKAHFFDSAECLLAYVNENQEQGKNAAFLLVTDFTKPGELTAARNAHFLQSKKLPSPMGMFLTALTNKATATDMQQEYGGKLLTWNEALLAVQNNERPE